MGRGATIWSRIVDVCLRSLDHKGTEDTKTFLTTEYSEYSEFREYSEWGYWVGAGIGGGQRRGVIVRLFFHHKGAKDTKIFYHRVHRVRRGLREG